MPSGSESEECGYGEGVCVKKFSVRINLNRVNVRYGIRSCNVSPTV